ncbi:MAG: cyclophilin-like fold protein [Longibaculum sp.]
MKWEKQFKIIFLMILFLFAGCQKEIQYDSVQKESEMKHNMQLIINQHSFDVTLFDNQTVKEFISQLPMTITMQDLHNNEKYIDLKTSFTTDEEKVNQIHAGDLMLFQDNCLVLFYEDFQTSYAYTKMGYVHQSEQLKKALGQKDIVIRLENKKMEE